ncbi:MAG: hypothetical protein DMF56_23080 [Acidobacteria bacterium]|nr:MAG: hypothetical protein DMF56_23080 [Acidobacteriota bacterium]
MAPYSYGPATLAYVAYARRLHKLADFSPESPSGRRYERLAFATDARRLTIEAFTSSFHGAELDIRQGRSAKGELIIMMTLPFGALLMAFGYAMRCLLGSASSLKVKRRLHDQFEQQRTTPRLGCLPVPYF